jgi:hypothetical protein
MDASGADRYRSLMDALTGDTDSRRGLGTGARYEWHPIGWRLVRLIIVLVVAYAVVTTALDLWRQYRVDTWSGPDASVTSGQRLEGCPAASDFHDAIFPAWVRFEGRLYLGSPAIRPVGSNLDNAYPVTPYRLGALQLLRVGNTPDGQAGRTILLKLESAPVGQVYARTEACS